MADRRIVTAVTGASGALYAVRFLRACLSLGMRVDLVVSEYGHRLLIEECGLNLKVESVEGWLERRYGPVPRETPLNLVQIENLRIAATAGAAIVPAMPAFYQKPQSLEDLADFIAGRVLSLLRIEHRLFPAWEG